LRLRRGLARPGDYDAEKWQASPGGKGRGGRMFFWKFLEEEKYDQARL
jgi:hypothetical protein